MSIIHWNPLHNLVFLSEKMSSLEQDLKESPGPEHWNFDDQWQPAVDVVCTEQEYIVYIALPGIPSEEIQLEIVDNALCVSGIRHCVSSAEVAACLRLEREYGKFNRRIQLERIVCEDAIQADLRDGVLRVRLAFAQPRKVSIESV